MKFVSVALLGLSMVGQPAGAQTQAHTPTPTPTHTHGSLAVDVAVDPQAITIRLGAPLFDLVGFERAPRSVAERGRVTALVDQLKAADKLFVLDAAGGCTLSGVQIASAVLGIGAGAAPAAKAEPAPEHAELDMTAVFACSQPAAARFIDVKLFDAFKGVRTVEAQLATAKGQARVTLRKAASRLALDTSAK